jgi:PAS domain S-box-containing protein
LPEAQQLGFGWFDQIHADDRGALMTAWSKAVAAGAPFKVEFRIRHRSGEYRWFDVHATALRDADDRIVKWFGMNFDITGVKPQDRAGQAAQETPLESGGRL